MRHLTLILVQEWVENCWSKGTSSTSSKLARIKISHLEWSDAGWTREVVDFIPSSKNYGKKEKAENVLVLILTVCNRILISRSKSVILILSIMSEQS